MAVAKANITLMISKINQRTLRAPNVSGDRTETARTTKPKTIKAERMMNPLATHDVLGLRHAVKNLCFLPRSRIKNGAPIATRMGPQRSAPRVRVKGTPKSTSDLDGVREYPSQIKKEPTT